jgi:multiple sugar transport system substrate-binding protein
MVSASALLAACAPTAGAPQGAAASEGGAAAPEAAEVVLMYQANEISDPEIAAFNEEYAPVKITRVDVDTTRYFAMFASDEAPDLLRVQAPALPQMLARNMLLNLQGYFEASDVLKIDDLVDVNNYYRAAGPMEMGGGDLYGMVKDWAPDAFLWINELVFEKAGVPAPDMTTPVEANDIGELARAITTRTGDQVQTIGFDTAGGFIDRYWMMLAENVGGKLYTDDFSAAEVVGNEPIVEAIKFFYDMAKDGAMTSPLNPSPNWFGPDFAASRLGIVWTGYWFHGFVVSDPTEDFQQGVAEGKVKMYPNFTWNGVRRNQCVTATGAIVSSQTKVPDAAWTVFEWFMGKEPAQNRAKSGWGLPGLNSLYDLLPKEGPLSSQAWTTIQDEMSHRGDVLHFNPFLAGGEPMVPGNVYLTNLEAALKDEMTFEDLLARIESETNVAIAEGKERIG